MSRIIKRKVIDRASSRLQSKQSTFRLPSIAPKSVDNFTLSIKRHMTDSYQKNIQVPEKQYPLRYDNNQQINDASKIQSKRYISPRKFSQNRYKQQQNIYTKSLHLRQRAKSQLYNERIEQNIKRYGPGMLKRQYKNALSIRKNEKTLLQLHYRLKKQRQLDILKKLQAIQAAKFKNMINHFQSI